MDEIWTVLGDTSYPATKAQLLESAAGAGAAPEIIARITALQSDSYASEDELGRDLAGSRASSNPSLVALSAELCEECGFPRVPGESHSCVEERARFSDSVQKVTDEFEILDESNRPA